MSQRFRTFLACGLTAAVLGAAPPAAAKTLCGALDPPTPYPFYVIEKVKTKRGAHGTVSGYLVSEDSTASAPFSASYAVYSDVFVNVAARWGTTQGFFGYATWLFNFQAPRQDGPPSQGYLTILDGNGGTVNDGGVFETTWVDCKSVPKFPAP